MTNIIGTSTINAVPSENTPARIFFKNFPFRFEKSIFFVMLLYSGFIIIKRKIDHSQIVKNGANSLQTKRKSAIRIMPNTVFCIVFEFGFIFNGNISFIIY
jgi:hypothetical protein